MVACINTTHTPYTVTWLWEKEDCVTQHSITDNVKMAKRVQKYFLNILLVLMIADLVYSAAFNHGNSRK